MSEADVTRKKILDAAWQLLEQHGDASVRLEDIAKHARLSRQAVYLHFDGRADLLIKLVEHVQEQLGFAAKMAQVEAASSGSGMLEMLAQFSGDYSPLVFPVARALDAVRRSDDAADAAWQGRMRSRHARAKRIAICLEREGTLLEGLSVTDAADLICLLTSVTTYEELVVNRGWSTRRYIDHLTRLLLASVVQPNAASPQGPSSRTRATRPARRVRQR